MTQRHTFWGLGSPTVAQLPVSPRVHSGTKHPCCMLSSPAMQLIPSLPYCTLNSLGAQRLVLVLGEVFSFSLPSLNHRHLPLTMNPIPSLGVSLCQLCQQDYVTSCRSANDRFGFHVSSIGQSPLLMRAAWLPGQLPIPAFPNLFLFKVIRPSSTVHTAC